MRCAALVFRLDCQLLEVVGPPKLDQLLLLVLACFRTMSGGFCSQTQFPGCVI
jgi:hypothetical protein